MLRWIAVLLIVVNIIYYVTSDVYVDGAKVVGEKLMPASENASLALVSERKHIDADRAKIAVTPTKNVVTDNHDAEKAELVVSGQDEDAQKEFCWDIGKFDDESQGKDIKQRLTKINKEITFDIQNKTIAGEPDYWVFLGPYESRRQALVVHRDMQARKIDSFLIADGELKNAVSLGLFSKEVGAKKMQEERKKQGLDARIKAVPRMRTEWWGELRSGAEIGEEKIKALISVGSENSLLEIKSKTCEMIANNKKLD